MAEIIEISRLSLHDQVAARLRTMLIEGRIAPGAKLNERELCEQLRVSRTPLREAIKLLAAEGLVDLLPNRGAVAVRLTEADVLNTFEVLAMLEGMSGELAAQRIGDGDLAELRALHYEMLACYARRDLSGYYRLNALIHTAINNAAGNPVLTATYRSINARVQSLRFRTNQNEAKWKSAVKEHEQMLEALDARDGAALRKVLVEHLLRKRDTVLDLLRAGEIYPNAIKS
ncbi:GntR family transcriptional regulator [Variovorax sp. J22G21]|uniref:GntR family transcriptional regulator n=1 Tax=Variovorax fucosicus TaxID=3053517 RepID=UPI0025768666|nr:MULTISPECIES: GntR family transcriptional regulator [unclassified Variovorax]MDM0041227.1 GntR family transcriptional regulator [Variovorax sp. J22R193]MDM0059042.1 GntR family transcriptional regulator [Variovorax sp. J22G47]MDM0060284.1 GntR family transcriptional regulator [Variovorax sp. J22G21]